MLVKGATGVIGYFSVVKGDDLTKLVYYAVFCLGVSSILMTQGTNKIDRYPPITKTRITCIIQCMNITLDRKPLSRVWFWSWKISQWLTRLTVFLFIQVYLVPLLLSDSFSCLNNIQLVTEVNYLLVTMNGPLIYSIQITQVSCRI